MHKKIVSSILIVGCALILGCAGQIPPGGGALDTFPPEVIRTFPDTNAVRVSADRIEIEFNEYVDRRSVEESIFISPYVGQLEFDWSGTEVVATFAEPLRKQTTYVVNIGTDVVDIRGRNRLATGYTLAFSTGDSIDQGSISGRVFDEKPEGIMLFAYALTERDRDTLDPTKTKPDYIMQTGKNGIFTLSNIALGPYRLIACRDEYRNLLYDRQIDQYGVATGDILLTEDRMSVRDVWFQLSQEDTTRPFLSSAFAPYPKQIEVRFSEPLDTATFAQSQFNVADTLSGDLVKLRKVTQRISMPALVDIVVDGSLDSGRTYRLEAHNVFDRAGNPIDTANARYFVSVRSTLDTLKPTFGYVGITDSMRNVPLDNTITLQFSEPVVQLSPNSFVSLRDSTKKLVPIHSKWNSLTELEILPSARLMENAWYQLSVAMDSVRDFSGNSYKDSVSTVRFASLDLRTTGEIEGSVFDGDGDAATGDFYITVSKGPQNIRTDRTIKMKQSGKFKIAELPEGLYTLRAFRDEDSSGEFSFGKPFPFQKSERFIQSSDSVKVRARWGVDGITLRLPVSIKEKQKVEEAPQVEEKAVLPQAIPEIKPPVKSDVKKKRK